jgi:hypothetical protein
MDMKKLVSLLLLFLALPLCMTAQSKSETKQYGKLAGNPTMKAVEKFLKKYPSSVYAPKVLGIKDSLIRIDNTSLISREQALDLAGECLDAIGWKKDGREHILALDKDFTLRILSPEGKEEATRIIPVYSMEDAAAPASLTIPMEIISPLGGRYYLHLAYLNGASEYVEMLYLPEEDILNQAIFYGNPLKLAAGEAYKIEGQSPESIEGLNPTAEVLWLLARFKENPGLVPISKADLLTDNAIKWWLERNPKAETSATRLAFGLLDPESSIVAAYKKARKEKGKNYNVALFDLRGYTIICAGSRTTGEYSLVWCEPVCKNRNRDKFLNTIYFEKDGNVLDLFYYKGKSTFKVRISMASQAVRR